MRVLLLLCSVRSRIADGTMRYGDFAKAIGLGDKWQPWYRQQIAEILNLVAATEEQAGADIGVEPLQFERIVNSKGEPGKGVRKTGKIVRVSGVTASESSN